MSCSLDGLESGLEGLFQVDRAFCSRASEAGIRTAFLEYAAQGAVLYRNGMNPVVGKTAIGELLVKEAPASLIWEPVSGEIAQSEDFGYTRGSFTYRAMGQEGKPYELTGHYVSIWKKQKNGQWKWVFDSGVRDQ